MDLNKIVIETRLRTAWQATDIGIALTRLWWWPLFLSWFVPGFLILGLGNIFLFQQPFVAFLIFWWFKPFYDRLPLFYASRALFSEHLPLKTLLKSSGSIFKVDCLPWLLWRRFSYQRSFVMPVTLLEGLKGAQRKKRITTLQNDLSSAPTWLTILILHLEQFFPFAILAIISLFIPEWYSFEYQELYQWYQSSKLSSWVIIWLLMLGMALLAPFYTVCGFILYINRRIMLEGWDIEIRFKALVNKYSDGQSKWTVDTNAISNHVSGLLVWAVVSSLFVSSLYATPSYAAEQHPISSITENQSRSVIDNTDVQKLNHDSQVFDKSSSDNEKVRAEILSVLNGEDFVNLQTKKMLQLKKNRSWPWLERFIKWLLSFTLDDEKDMTGFAKVLTKIFEYTLYILVVGIIVYLVYRFRHYLGVPEISLSRDKLHIKPKIMFGLDVRPESLPDNMDQVALNLIEQKKYREALSLIYRSSLSYLINVKMLMLHKAQTELECAHTVKKSVDEVGIKDYFNQLTHVWVNIAYAHELPEHSQVLQLCQQWPDIFSESKQDLGMQSKRS